MKPMIKVTINNRTRGIVTVVNRNLVSTASVFWKNTMSANNEITRMIMIFAFFIVDYPF